MLLLDTKEGQSIESFTRVAFIASIRSNDLRETVISSVAHNGIVTDENGEYSSKRSPQ